MVQGPGWGVFATAVPAGDWTWSLLTQDRGLLVATVGLPFGLGEAQIKGGPAELGRTVLDGTDDLDDVVPPFGVMATDGMRFAVRQDWFGMASLYTYRAHGVFAFSNRPALLPYALGDDVEPVPRAWARYAACDSFAGPVAPVAGVQALGPGLVITGTRDPRHRWRIGTHQAKSMDDVARRAVGPDRTGDADALAEAGFARVTSSLAALWRGPLRCGLSAGRDSRLLAATLIANDVPTRFFTNTEYPAEEETARRLIALASAARGTPLVHDLVPPRIPGADGPAPLAHRLRRLFLDYDYCFRRASVIRPLRPVPAELPPAIVNGYGGDAGWGAYVPRQWRAPAGNPAEEVSVALRRGVATKTGGTLVEPAATWLREYLDDLTAGTAELGLNQAQLLNWMFLACRVRTWATPRQDLHNVMLYATPEFLEAMLTLPLERMLASDLHRSSTARLVPQWAGVGYLHGVQASPRQPPAIWDGDGRAVLAELVESTTTTLTWMLDATLVREALTRIDGEGEDARQVAKTNQFLTTFSVFASAERDFAALNAEVRRSRERPDSDGIGRMARWVARLPEQPGGVRPVTGQDTEAG
jgi:asparagine synthase (glutamine-hydrolysing)